jgi:hypothetical protein
MFIDPVTNSAEAERSHVPLTRAVTSDLEPLGGFPGFVPGRAISRVLGLVSQQRFEHLGVWWATLERQQQTTC